MSARFAIMALSALALIALVTPAEAALCDSQTLVHVAIATQSSGRFMTAPERYLQSNFANALSQSVRALNDNADRFPQVSTTTSTSRYARNSVFWYDYHDATIGGAFTTTVQSDISTPSAAGDFVANGNGRGSYPNTDPSFSPRLSKAFDTVLNSWSPAAPGSQVWPYTSEAKVAVVINDGDFSTVAGSVTPNTATYTSDANFLAANQIAELNNAKCSVAALVKAGFQVIFISNNRSTVAGVPQPLFNFASSNLNIGNGAAFAPNTNTDGKVHYYPFSDYSELMSERILGQISAYIRSLGANRQVSASCSISGDPHFTTFDGLHYDYQGSGDYWLFRSLAPNDPLSVQYRAAPCADGASCTVGASISDGVDRFEVVIADRSGNPKNAYLVHNGAKVPLSSYLSNTFTSNVWGNANVTVQSQGTTSYVVQIRFNAGHYLSVQRNLIVFTPAAHLYGKSTGMCGNWNSCPADDLLDSCQRVQTLNSSDPFVASRFGDSWTVRAGESLFTTAPPQGVSHWEVSNNAVCDFRPTQLLQTPMYTRWPYLPPMSKDINSIPAPGISTFGWPNVDYFNSASNNNGLVVLNPIPAVSAFQIPTACVRTRGALLADCLFDSPRNAASVDSTLEILYQACTTYCKTGRLFTNLVTPADCIAAQICALGSVLPDLHQDYSTGGVLPQVSFGNGNQPQTFFQPTLGLAGRYLLQVSESDLCGVSTKTEAVDITCATETPQVVLSFPGLTTASGTQPTSTDPLVIAIVSVVPDALAGFPLVTIKADVFPANTLLGHHWKIISYPNSSTTSNITVFAPELTGETAGRVRFQPNFAGTYVLEYAVWTGCTVSRARALVFASCSLAPPSASIQPLPSQYTPGWTTDNWNNTWDRSSFNYVSVTWIGDPASTVSASADVAPTIFTGTTTSTVNPVLDSTIQANIIARQNRWSTIKLTPYNTFDVDSPKSSLRYKWSVSARRTDSLGITLVDTKTTTTNVANSGSPSVPSSTCTNGVYPPTLSSINQYSRLYWPTGSKPSIKTTYTFAIPATATPATTSTSSNIQGVASTPVYTYSYVQPKQYFGASSNFPEGAVSPFNNLFNVYLETATVTQVTQNWNEFNTTSPFVQPLCQVVLTQNPDNTATIDFNEVGNTPNSFNPVNYCKDAFYDVTLTAQDECQENSDMITLQPTCDGYVQAILNCDQTIYYDASLNSNLGGWAAATLDGAQSYDEMANSNWVLPANRPMSRSVVYEWTLKSVTPFAAPTTGAPASGVANTPLTSSSAYPFTSASTLSSSQSIWADVAGTYQVQLRVSNKCAVSKPVTSNIVFSCWGAPACDATYTTGTLSATVDILNGGVAAPYVPGTSTNIQVSANFGVALGSITSTNSFQTVTFTDTITATSTSHTVNLKHRYRVTSAPTGSAYANKGSATLLSVTQWSAVLSPLTFRPDVAGSYQLTIETTEGCNCDIKTYVVNIDAACSARFKDNLDILFQNLGSSVPFLTPSDYASSQTLTVGSPLTIKTSWGTMSPATAFAAASVNNVTWTVDGPAGSAVVSQTTKFNSFVYYPAAVGTYNVRISTYDGCQVLMNATSFAVVAAGTATPVDCSTAPTPDPRILGADGVTPSGAGAASVTASSYFYTYALPKVNLAAYAGFATSSRPPWATDIQWYITSAPADSIYSVGQVVSNSAAFNTYSQLTFDKYNFANNVNYQVATQRNYSSSTTTTATTMARIPLPGFFPGSTGSVTQAQVWDSVAYGPQQWGPSNGTNIAVFQSTHSQVCVTLDRPGTYTFRLRYINGSSASYCPMQKDISYTVNCSPAVPTAAITVTPTNPQLDSYKPLRVSVSAAGSDADGASEQLSYSWSFVSAPGSPDPIESVTVNQRTNATSRTGVELIDPFHQYNPSGNPTNFPPIFNPHLPSASFLALAPGNYTLNLRITDGCNVNTIPVVVLVGCAGKNSYGSVAAPVVKDNFAANALTSGSTNANSYTISDALTGAVPVGGVSASNVDVTRALNVQWSIVGFTPAYASNTLQSSRASRNLQVSTFEQVTVFENNAVSAGVPVDNSESGLSKSSKLGLAIAFPIIGGLIIIAIVVWLVMRRSSNKVAAGGARVQQQPVEASTQ